MKSLDLGRCVLSISLAAAVLAACGGSQSPIGAPARIMQNMGTEASSYQVLYSFSGSPDGEYPCSSLVDVSGTLYGTTDGGGKVLHGGGRHGTVFSISTTGLEHVLHRFGRRPDGYNPCAGLIDVHGTLYGTTFYGGTYYKGTVFSVSTTGKEHVLHGFSGPPDGAGPAASLTDVSGTLYGATYRGGTYNAGTIFSISTSGSVHVLHSFISSGPDGSQPDASLIDVHGTLYGTTLSGGTYYKGTVFSVSTTGKEQVLYSFGSKSDGFWPEANLVDASGTLYGTTRGGGTRGGGGTVFSITPGGTEKVLHSFGSGTDGNEPSGGLIEVKGTLYGTTYAGGKYNGGTIFSITTGGTEKVLHSFGHGSDGKYPQASLINVNGTLYGTTAGGGANTCYTFFVRQCGTVFALTP